MNFVEILRPFLVVITFKYTPEGRNPTWLIFLSEVIILLPFRSKTVRDKKSLVFTSKISVITVAANGADELLNISVDPSTLSPSSVKVRPAGCCVHFSLA